MRQKIREYRKAAELIEALSPEEQACRPFRIRATEMLELLDYAELATEITGE